ncbi:hypothetical protein D5086_026520 [Populus alba]|uniref:Uncharacterized protein n=1 Tax=Populus alba TaxID=43335 RepID=A0ACC4B2W7_POPAL
MISCIYAGLQNEAGVPASTAAPTTTSSTTTQTSLLGVASTSGTSSSVSTALTATPKLPSEITGKTVEEIIKEWNAELQERTGKFRKQATAIAEWDKRILQNRDVLLRLEIEVAKVVETQANLERKLELIETHQQEVDKALQSIEEEAERIYKDERGSLLDDEAASTRDAMYEQAEFIEREMEQMTEQIKSVIQTVNANQGGELDAIDGMTPLDMVVRILNNQLSSLMWIDEKAEEFSSRIQKLASQAISLHLFEPNCFRKDLDLAFSPGIPKKFVRLYGKGLSNKVLLEVPNGTVSEVELFKSDGKIWLQNGWKEFAEHYSLALGSLLVFEYKNRCHFHVLIMDKTAMEIDYSFSMTDGDEEPDLEGEFQQPKTEETDDDVSVEILDDFPSYHKTNEKSSAPCPEPQKRTRTNFASKFERTSKLQIRSESVATKQDNSVGKKKRLNGVNRAQSLTADEKAATFERASAALKPESPFFMVAMQPSYVYPGCRLNLPFKFADRYFKEKNGEVILQVSEGRLWTVDYSWKLKKTFLCSYNWMEFARDNNLEVGDVCVFELIKATELGMNVVILRTEDVSWCPSFCKQGIQVMNCILNSN